MAYDFHYTPTGTGVISGKEVLEQTEDAINDLGNTAISGVQEALDKAEQALTNSANAVDDAQTALNTANNAEGVAIQAQTDVGNLSGTVTNIGNRVTTAEGNISNLQGRMTTAESNITNLQGRMTTAETNIGNLQTAVSTAQATANSAQQTATTARQQSYVFRYSGTAVVPNSTIAYSTIDNTDNIKSGDKILDVDGKLFEITAVDTTNQTVTVGSALIDLALDGNVVHTSGNETVGGQKTFTNSIILQNSDTSGLSRDLFCKSQLAVLGDAVSGDNTKYRFVDKNDNEICYIRQRKLINSNTDMSFCVNNIDNDNNSISAEINFVIDRNNDPRISPSVTDSISLGRPTFRWKSIYSNSYYYGNVEFSTKFVTTDTAQTISGAKTFSDNLTIYNSDDTVTPKGLTIKNAQWGMGESGGTTASSINFLDKNSVVPASIIASKGSSGQSFLRFSVRTKDSQNNTYAEEIYYNVDTSGNVSFRPWHDNTVNLGASIYKWKDCQTYQINGLTPSSLSLPSDRSARVDISGYITNLGNGDNNSYTVPANGYIWLHFTSINSALCYSQTSGGLTNYAQTFARYSGEGQLYAFFPVRNGDNFVVQIYTSSTAVVQNAYFIPCQGNI